jgi:hypothetical protein
VVRAAVENNKTIPTFTRGTAFLASGVSRQRLKRKTRRHQLLVCARERAISRGAPTYIFMHIFSIIHTAMLLPGWSRGSKTQC